MTRDEKKAAVEKMAENFMQINDAEVQSFAVLCMSAYIEGKAAGRAEERQKWERKEMPVMAV